MAGVKPGLGIHVIRDLAKAGGCCIEVEVLNENETTIHLKSSWNIKKYRLFNHRIKHH